MPLTASKKKPEDYVVITVDGTEYRVTPSIPLSAAEVCLIAMVETALPENCYGHLRGGRDAFQFNERGVIPQWNMCIHTHGNVHR